MSTEDSVGFTKLPQLGLREKTLLRQQHIERQAAVSFAQDKTVPLRPARVGRVIFQNLVVKDTEHFHQRERRTDVAAPARFDHAHDLAAQVA